MRLFFVSFCFCSSSWSSSFLIAFFPFSLTVSVPALLFHLKLCPSLASPTCLVTISPSPYLLRIFSCFIFSLVFLSFLVHVLRFLGVLFHICFNALASFFDWAYRFSLGVRCISNVVSAVHQDFALFHSFSPFCPKHFLAWHCSLSIIQLITSSPCAINKLNCPFLSTFIEWAGVAGTVS